MTDKQIIIEDCPHFIGGCCQEYLDGICENHKCDLKIIRELEQQLDKLKAERDSYIDKYFLESQKVINLKKVLIEIKEILLFHKQELEECLHNDIDGQILQKISEV